VAAYIAAQGDRGATRDELSLVLELPIQSICSPVRVLLEAGVIVETHDTRPTRYGSPAAVLIARRANA